MPKPLIAPAWLDVEADEERHSSQPASILIALLEENAKQQLLVTNQTEALMQAAKEQSAHLAEALRLCKLQQPVPKLQRVATVKSLADRSNEEVSGTSKWAASVEATPPPHCSSEKVTEAALKTQDSREEGSNFMSLGTSHSEPENEDQAERRNSAAIADLIGAKGWNMFFESEATPMHAISERRRTELKRHEAFIQRLVRSKHFDVAVGILILVNSLFIGFQVEYGEDERYTATFLVGSLIFCVLFTSEVVLRVLSEGWLICVKAPLWNLFDAVVVISSITELCLRLAVGEESSSGRNTSVFRTLRVLRFIRFARVLKVMRVFRELRMMIFSIMHCLHSIVWAMALLLVFTFIFGITFTQGVKDALQDESFQPQPGSILLQRFGSLERTILTLIQAVLGGISWAELSDKLRELHWAYELLFFAFEALTVLALLNIVTGVFVDGAMRSASQDRDLIIQDQISQDGAYAQELRKLFMEADCNRTGYLSMEEFLDYVQDDRVQSYLRAMQIHISEAKSLFHLLDIDDSGTVTVDEFVAGCLRYKGEAKGVDVLTLMYENKKMVNTIVGALEALGQDVQVLRQSSNKDSGELRERRQSTRSAAPKLRRLTTNGFFAG